MHWVRAKRRIGAWVALFALSLQFVLSFGHVHVHKAALAGPALVGISTQQAASGGGAPSDSDRRRGADDFCAICATISLASTLLVPDPLRLTLPIGHAQAWLPEFQVALAASAPHLLFQARAPPRASLMAG